MDLHAIAAERKRILDSIDALVNIKPGATVTWPDGSVADKSESDGALIHTIKAVVRGA